MVDEKYIQKQIDRTETETETETEQNKTKQNSRSRQSQKCDSRNGSINRNRAAEMDQLTELCPSTETKLQKWIKRAEKHRDQQKQP